jgi:hypothetical protein
MAVQMLLIMVRLMQVHRHLDWAVHAPSLRNYGPGYKEKELAAGAAAERFRPGAGFPGQQGAADRAYQQELSRTAQLTAQDPELQTL